MQLEERNRNLYIRDDILPFTLDGKALKGWMEKRVYC